MNRNRLMKITCIFFVLMLCFTLLSRAADQAGIAVVTTKRPESMMISHQVQTTGKVVQNQEIAVTTEPDQRVTAIYVNEGERVAKGDLLFEIDLTLLQEKILAQEQEMEKQQLQVEDAKSQKEVGAMQKANEQAQASEQYSLNTRQANVQLSRAKAALTGAKEALQEYRKSSRSTEEDSSVEEALEAAYEEKSEAYLQAEQELASLQWQIENAVNTALEAAKSRASLAANEPVRTQSAQIEEELPDDAGIISEAADSEPGPGAGTDAAPDFGTQDIILEEVEVVSPPESSTASGGSAAGGQNYASDNQGGGSSTYQTDAGNPGAGQDIVLPEGQAGDGGTGAQESGASGASVSQEELARIEQEVRDGYQQELAAAKSKVETAQAEKETAQAALTEYQQERLAASDKKNAETEQQLIDNVKTAQQAYEDAALAANQAAVTSGRAVQTAGIPDASNSSDRINEITYEQMELALEKLEKLLEDDGKIYAQADGLITKISIVTGEKTTDTTAILMADVSKGYRFTAGLTKEQEKYIGAGDLVTLSGSGSNKQTLEDLPVESVMEDEENEGVFYVTVQIPEDTFDLGTTVTLDFSKKSETYNVCVPLSALYLDSMNQTYVLVPEEYDTIMGTEIKLRKVNVTVLEKNETNAALAEGSVTSQQEVIVSSDKAVAEGSRVRVSS